MKLDPCNEINYSLCENCITLKKIAEKYNITLTQLGNYIKERYIDFKQF